MRSPEEVWDEIEDGFDSVTQWGISDDQRARVADLIRARDAEVAEQVRAETLEELPGTWRDAFEQIACDRNFRQDDEP